MRPIAVAARHLLAFALPLALLAAPAGAEELTDGKRQDIRRLIESTGGSNVAKQFASASSRQMFQMLKAMRPDIPDRTLIVMDRELMGLFSEKMGGPDGLVEQVVPIYHKHLTHAEIRELIAFYETPIGRKTIAIMPQVVAESMQAGQRWGQALAPEIQRRVKDALLREGLVSPTDLQ